MQQKQRVIHRPSPAVTAGPAHGVADGRTVARPTAASRVLDTKVTVQPTNESAVTAMLSIPPVRMALPQQRPFSAARDLLAKRGKCRPRDRKKKKCLTSVPGARLEHLMCFIENNGIQNDMASIGEIFEQQCWELGDINRSRSQDVALLSLDAVAVKAMMREPEDALRCGCDCSRDGAASFKDAADEEQHQTLQAALDRRRLLREDLQRQVEVQSADLAKVREKAEHALIDAAAQDTRFKLLVSLHEQEVQELRHHLSLEQVSHVADEALGEEAGSGEPNSLSDCFGQLPLAVDAARQRSAMAEQLRVEEATKLRTTERRLHCEEVEAVWRDIKATSDTITAAGGLSVMHSLAIARLSEVDRRELQRCCEELWRPASLFLAALEQPALPPVPSLASELDDWLEHLRSQLNMNGDAPQR